jgi:subtilisin family serine protease
LKKATSWKTALAITFLAIAVFTLTSSVSRDTVSVSQTGSPISAETDSIYSAALSSSRALSAKESAKKGNAAKDYVSSEIIVKYRKNSVDLTTTSGINSVRSTLASKNLVEIESLAPSNTVRLKITDGSTVDAKVAEFRGNPDIEYAEPNYKRDIATISTNDPSRGQLWGLDNTGQTVAGTTGLADKDIDGPEAWAINEGTNTALTVAVLDTGVAYNHPDLSTSMWDGTSCKDENGTFLGGCTHGYDFQDEDKIPLPTISSHGTHVAGTIAAAKNNGVGIIGVAPNVKIMALKFGLDTYSEVRSIDFAIQNGAKVINASFGGDSYSQTEYDAINRFKNAGGIFVAAAGNGGADGVGDNNDGLHFYPSDYTLSNIISVAATNQSDALASFSNYGVTSVDVGAPGTNIYSTVADTAVMSESFEGVVTPAVPSGWVKAGTNNKWGTGTGTDGKALYGQVPSSPYDNNTDSTISSPAYNLSGAPTSAKMSFTTTCDTQYATNGWYDYMQLEYSADGITFTPAEDPFNPPEAFKWDESYIDSDSSPVGSAEWTFDNLDIPSQYHTANFKYRFRWVTDASDNNYAGCSVDNISVTSFSDGNDNKYAYYNGTSMAAPHVAGLVGLIEGYNSSLTSTQAKNIVLASGDDISSLHGITTSGKRINAYSAMTAATNYVDPTVVSLVRQDTTGQTGLQAGDKVTVTFSKPMSQEVITKSNIDDKLPLLEYVPDPVDPQYGFPTPFQRSWKDGSGNIGSAVWTSSTTLQITISTTSGAPALTSVNPYRLDFGYSVSKMTDTIGTQISGNPVLTGIFDPAVQALHHINISPATTQTISVGQSIPFTAQGQDISNNNISGLTYSWTGANQSGLFIGINSGEYQVKANTSGVSSTKTTVIVVPSAYTFPISASLWLSNLSPMAGETVNGAYTVKNTTTVPMTLTAGLADMNLESGQWNSFPQQTFTIPASSEKTFYFTRVAQYPGPHQSWISINYNGVWYNARPLVSQLVSFNYPVRPSNEAISVSASLGFSNISPAAGETLSIGFGIKNETSSNLTVDAAVPDLNTQTGEWNSFTPQTGITLTPGQSKYLLFNKIVRSPGTHRSWIAVNINGTWYDVKSFNGQMTQFTYGVRVPNIRMNYYYFEPLPPKPGERFDAHLSITNLERTPITVDAGVPIRNNDTGAWNTMLYSAMGQTLSPNVPLVIDTYQTLQSAGYTIWPSVCTVGYCFNPKTATGIEMFWAGRI